MEVDGLPKAKYFGHSNPFLEFYTKEELPPGTNPRRRLADLDCRSFQGLKHDVALFW